MYTSEGNLIMGKKKTEVPQTWGGRMKDWGGGDFTFLSSDGESITFIVVGLPELMESNYKGKKGERIGCPCVTDTGYQLFVCGKRVGRKLAKIEKTFPTNAIMVIRHGEEGDVNAKYSVKVLPEKETFTALMAIKEQDFDPEMIPESIKAALEVMQG
jgi:hypothetical protein